jgi:hypothetical protein
VVTSRSLAGQLVVYGAISNRLPPFTFVNAFFSGERSLSLLFFRSCFFGVSSLRTVRLGMRQMLLQPVLVREHFLKEI